MSFAIKQQDIYEHTIKQLYSEDRYFLERSHIVAGQGLDACVTRTVDDFSKADNFKFYTMTNEVEKLIGYFGTEVLDDTAFLTGFFIRKSERSFQNKLRFWQTVKTEIRKEFLTAINVINIKAINFCFLGGGKIKDISIHEDRSWFIFHFKNQ